MKEAYYTGRNSLKNKMVLYIGIFVSIAVGSAWGEKVAKVDFLGIAERMHNKTLTVKDDAVAYAEVTRAKNSLDMTQSGKPTSLMFIIDNSGSMISGESNDFYGNRFIVTRDILTYLNKTQPNMEVGISFFATNLALNPSADAVFKKASGDKGAYIPLLRLNQNYNGKTGYEILMYYLETTDNNWDKHVELAHKNALFTDLGSGETNINVGFEGAKEGLAASSFEKEKRFIIFYSDGISTKPDDASKENYVKGESVPTAFTVFLSFDDKKTIPDNLKTMTENIKKNGYSGSNPLSNIWSIQTEHDTLLNLLMKNVIAKIISNISDMKPSTCTINKNVTVSNWNGQLFTFPDLHPLTGVKTDFLCDIKYKVTKDSITEKGDTIHITMRDTVHNVKYTVGLDANAQPQDSVKLIYWGRNLKFYHNGNPIDWADETKTELELRFTEYMVDILYGYTDVKLQLVNRNGSPLDEENFTLTKNGDYYSVKFSQKIGTAVKGDNILQHGSIDTLVATFRNPKLPLDTLVARIPFQISSITTPAKAVYYDDNADGFIDRIACGMTTTINTANCDEIARNLNFAAYRNFTLVKAQPTPTGLACVVKENRALPFTAVTKDDKVWVKDTIYLKAGGILMPGSVEAIDSVAPVINSASVVDSAAPNSQDILSVYFSEKVQPVTQKVPFYFIKTSAATQYEAELANLSQKDSSATFKIVALKPVSAIDEGDSIFINWTQQRNVQDARDNNQSNKSNVKRLLAVTKVKNVVTVEKAAYFDANANGFIDSMTVTFNRPIDPGDCLALASALVLADHRKLSITAAVVRENSVILKVDQKAVECNTAVTSADKVSIAKDVFLPSGMCIPAVTVPVADSMAPVIMKAFVQRTYSLQTGLYSDLLYVTFSETVGAISQKTPFWFYSMSAKKDYNSQMNCLNQQDNTARFAVEKVMGVDNIMEGDSIAIRWDIGMNVCDLNEKNQDNPINIRRELTIDAQVELSLIASIVDKAGTMRLPSSMLTLPGVKEVIPNTDGVYKGMGLIFVEAVPRANVSNSFTLKGRLTLMDGLGNVIFKDREMGYDSTQQRLIYLWDGHNSNQRSVSIGTYLAIAQAQIIHKKSQQVIKKTLRGFVGVRSSKPLE
ncbi:MAG: VWA domain-containing protein [Chitinivibrionales bacterium]|nr:VWA domain-containing protein [Chitinivibrionales bacterium]